MFIFVANNNEHDDTRLDYISIPPIVTPHVTPHSPSSHTLDSNSECSD